jgi:hypothetical protein
MIFARDKMADSKHCLLVKNGCHSDVDALVYFHPETGVSRWAVSC